jgi:hypothetical protein
MRNTQAKRLRKISINSPLVYRKLKRSFTAMSEKQKVNFIQENKHIWQAK